MIFRFIVVALMASLLAACSDVSGVSNSRLQPETIRAGITAEQHAKLRPIRNGQRFEWQLTQQGSDFVAFLELRSRRTGRGYSLRGDLKIPLPGDNVKGIADQLAKATKRRVRVQGNFALIATVFETDRNLRATKYQLLGQSVRHVPHDCYGVLGACRSKSINQGTKEERTLIVTTTETGGRWTAVSRLDPKAHGGRSAVIEAEVYSLDTHGLFIDSNYLDVADGDRYPLRIRRK